ncbi:MAG: glutamine--fructose-6-phosphate transaminase (isomerizing) [Rickettsiales bacterium]|jgi:glucosamine--fructose-6-phosphate aminotransferase (isomerizing)|nr:glutamine--fructose-6-phosphate transaminase (isomerizing) [Rickettsiales bacterium]
MCGIFGVISKNNNITNCLIDGLKLLEYRGYDSSGIAVINNGKFAVFKEVGKIAKLQNNIGKKKISGNIGIAHSRWATHGGVTNANSHPHLSSDGLVCVVHNGIIENYKELKNKLIKNGYKFISETDTEVISNLISYNLKHEGDNKKAIFKTIKELRGTWGLAILFSNDIDRIYLARCGSPLLIGIGEGENYASSGSSAFSELTNKIIYLNEGDVALLSKDDYKIYNEEKLVDRQVEIIDIGSHEVSKGKFANFTLKEIYEQPQIVKNAINEYIVSKKVILPKFDFELSKIKRLNIISIGSSYNASYIAKYFIEDIAKISVNIENSAEFLYKSPHLDKDDFSLFISQSGETADTVGALKLCKNAGQKIMSVINTLQSNMAYLSDVILKTLSGIEIGVAATKSVTGQVVVLYLLGIEIAKVKNLITLEQYYKYISDIEKLPEMIESFLKSQNVKRIRQIAKEIAKDNYYICMGRNIFYPVAIEGALKISELCYVPCIGISAGDFKHGPIAVVDKNTHIIAINPMSKIFDKSSSNIEEVVARGGKIILISDKNGKKILETRVKDTIVIPQSDNLIVSAVLSLIPLQLLSYYIAIEKGNDVDKPRNLAKSVTVE